MDPEWSRRPDRAPEAPSDGCRRATGVVSGGPGTWLATPPSKPAWRFLHSYPRPSFTKYCHTYFLLVKLGGPGPGTHPESVLRHLCQPPHCRTHVPEGLLQHVDLQPGDRGGIS